MPNQFEVFKILVIACVFAFHQRNKLTKKEQQYYL